MMAVKQVVFTDFFTLNPDERTIDEYCRYPNISYRFETQFNHFLFYRDSFAYDDLGNQYLRSELRGIEEGDFGEDSARDKCLELLLKDKDILYRTVFVKSRDSPPMKEITTPHAGWVD